MLEIVIRDGLAEKARASGARLAAGFGTLKQRHGCIGDVRGRGVLLGLEFTQIDGKDPNAVTDAALALGLSANIVRGGASGATMRIAPLLTVSDSEIDLGLELLDAAISRVMLGHG